MIEKSFESFLVKMMMKIELNEEYEQISKEIRNAQVSLKGNINTSF